jgi:mxaJ protein
MRRLAAPLLAVLLLGAAPDGAGPALRVCADPDNLPYSNARGEGFDNRIAEVLSRELGMRLQYTWAVQRRGLVRITLAAGACDVLLGVPSTWDPVLATRPYYRSTYVFVWQRDRALDVQSLDDPRLRTLRVGIQLIGDNGVNTPPAHALARRGIVDNVRGYPVLGGPEILAALSAGDIDVAIVWGPLAGYFAGRLATPLALAPVTPSADPSGLAFTFAMAAGVRKDDTALRDRLQAALDHRADEVRAILDAYAVPPVERSTP